MSTTRSDELRHSPAARDTKSSSAIIIIIFGIFQFLFYVFRYADCDFTWKRNYPKARRAVCLTRVAKITVPFKEAVLPFGYKK
jgi:hypothetical protein